MTIASPVLTTWGDLCTEALKDCGYLGLGMNPLAEDVNGALARAQWMMSQWQNERWYVYHNVTYSLTATGQITPYSIGPAFPSDFQSPTFNSDFVGQPQLAIGTYGKTGRPDKIESCVLRQVISSPNQPVDYVMRLVKSMEDYNESIAIKNLTQFALVAYYDPAWPVGYLYCWPWPANSLYALVLTIREQLGTGFALGDKLNLPYEYYLAIVSNLALLLRPKYGIATGPSDSLAQVAKQSRGVLKNANYQMGNLVMPRSLRARGQYNIYSDQSG